MTVDGWRQNFPDPEHIFPANGLFPFITALGIGTGLLALPAAYPVWQPVVILTLLLVSASLLASSFRLPPALWISRALTRRAWTLLPFLLGGYGYGHWMMADAFDNRVPLCADSRIRQFDLQVLDVPQLETMTVGGKRQQSVARFQAGVSPHEASGCLGGRSYRVRLSWYDPPTLRQGAHWRVEGRLRPPWGNSNPGGFDYERWLLGQSLNGTGYVRSGRLLAGSEAPGSRRLFRVRLAQWLAARKLDHQGFIQALMMGDDAALTRRDWQLLRDSGTVHLLVVSGLHVGMVTSFLFYIFRWLIRSVPPLLERLGARRMAGTLALAVSGLYVWLSGAGVPAVRAWVMSALILTALCSGRVTSTLRIACVVMALTMLAQPLVVHQQGFWLSYVAVLALIAFFEPAALLVSPADTLFSGGRGRCRNWRRQLRPLLEFARVQILLLLVLSPLLATFQGGVPLQAPLVNGLVVPVVAFLVLPLVLIAGVLALPLPQAGEWAIQLADRILGPLLDGIETAAAVPAVAVSVDGSVEWLLLIGGLFFLGFRPGWPSALVLIALWWALLLPDQPPPRQGAFRITALDVGQGTAIVVETRNHRLIYDTGAAYPSGFDLGEAVVVPSFRRARNQSLNALVLSHDDLDHTGGAASVIALLKPERTWTSFPVAAEEPILPGHEFCRAGRQWRWDGVSFRFLHPPSGWRGDDNDSSCVLLVSNGRRSALLGGDISRRVERRLEMQPVDLLFAPHHGSKTSSSAPLIGGFRPAIVFISTDRRSRYGHPHPEVLERYTASDVHLTGRHGALVWESEWPDQVLRWRDVRSAYWHRWPQSQGRALSSL